MTDNVVKIKKSKSNVSFNKSEIPNLDLSEVLSGEGLVNTLHQKQDEILEENPFPAMKKPDWAYSSRRSSRHR